MLKKLIFVFLICSFLCAGFFLVPCIKVLSISNRKNTSEKIYSKDFSDGFIISYTHSVNKGRIHDFYVCNSDFFLLKANLKLEKSIFVSYGAGIPEPNEIKNGSFKVLENGYELSNINKVLPEFLMAVGVIAEHSISDFKSSNEYFFKDFFKVQTSLVFEIKRVSIFDFLSTKGFYYEW